MFTKIYWFLIHFTLLTLPLFYMSQTNMEKKTHTPGQAWPSLNYNAAVLHCKVKVDRLPHRLVRTGIIPKPLVQDRYSLLVY